MTERVSYCRICESICGVVAEVDNGVVVRVRGDDQHPVSKGYVCPKANSMARVLNDPDRVTRPMRRVGESDEFEPVEWDVALNDIAARLRLIRDDFGPHAISMYLGNPSAFSLSHMFWAKGFLDAVGSRNFYSAAAQDTFGRQAASHLLYGSPIAFPIPDIPATSYMLIVGANPLVSHGSILTLPRIADELRDIVNRGGRVVVLDPVRTKTAKAFEHISIRPGTDAWFLAGLLHMLFEESLTDTRAIETQTSGIAQLAAAVKAFTPQAVQAATGVSADVVVDIARTFAAADSAVAYGRAGVGRGPYATTTNYLIDALNIVTGNFDRPGGSLFGSGPVDLPAMGARFGMNTVGAVRTRVGNLPDIAGHLPWVLSDEIETPGDGQIRALVVTAGNPVLSAPDGTRLARLLRTLDLVVSLDLYVNETNRHAHYILPVPASLERSDLPLSFLAHMPRPFIQATDALVAPPATVREEWEIFDELAHRMKLGGPFGQRSARVLARILRIFRHQITPDLVTSALLRAGRSGWTLRRIRQHPHGVITANRMEAGRAPQVIAHHDKLVHLADAGVLQQLGTMVATHDNGELRLVGRRSLRAINSWLHNVSGEREPALWISPEDSTSHDLHEGDQAVLAGPIGEITVSVHITDDVARGTVSYAHGYGHHGGWAIANDCGGANVNSLVTTSPDSMDPLSGASHLDGLPVAVRRLQPRTASERVDL